MKRSFSRVFTLNVNGRPTLAFEAGSRSEARQVCKETWLWDDLTNLTSGGAPLCTAQSKLSVRLATSEEASTFTTAANLAGLSDEVVLRYLIELDA
jgi:hypothetical protein